MPKVNKVTTSSSHKAPSVRKTLSEEERRESHRAACAKYYMRTRKARILDVTERKKRKRDLGCFCGGIDPDLFCGMCNPNPDPEFTNVSAAFTPESSSRIVIRAIESWARTSWNNAEGWLPAIDLDHHDALEAGIADAWVRQVREEIAEGKRLLEGFLQWQTERQAGGRQLNLYRMCELQGLLLVGIARREDFLTHHI
ncbi:hypothetical protein PLICRDRAFT_178059 [Plicaturopsis crispa FD-325 SS-3]|nr:hypothetical protein PLICRDRAFT_178059 [Plicaturopsis crispa FD-325 SS-3]